MNAPSPTRPGHAALRRGRASLNGQIYLITFTTRGRRPVFANFDHSVVAVRAFVDARLWAASRLLAWVLMPDHWHGLVELGEGESLAVLIGRLKANTAREVRAVAPRIRRVWTPGFHDHALRCDEDVVEVARYIVLNPVRAGLVRRVGDYPFWDAVWVGQ